MYICNVENKDLYTVGTTEIYACGDMNPYGSSAQEAYTYLDYRQFTCLMLLKSAVLIGLHFFYFYIIFPTIKIIKKY